MQPSDRLIIALDFPSVTQARDMARLLRGRVGVFKIGMELVYSGGLELARELAEQGERVFLDLKLLDIGHTVTCATQAVARLGVSFLTVHAVDEKTLRAAVEGCGTSDLKLLGVTVMTNLDEADLRQQGICGQSSAELTLHRAQMAAQCGFDGVISSGHEAASIRQALGAEKLIITPAIRPVGTDIGDQNRVMTPQKAMQAGADYLVIGRPVTQAADPLAMVETIALQLAEG